MRHIIVSVVAGVAGLTLVMGQSPAADAEKEVRAEVESYTAAFNKGDLEGLLAHFADDADFINDGGKQLKGKANLAELFKQTLADLKGCKLAVTITSLRFLRPDVALLDGKATLTAPDGASESGRFTTAWTKSGGKWLLSSVHDLAEPSETSTAGSAPLQQLDWLVGDWTYEDPSFNARVSGRWTLNQRFLLLEYTVKQKDSEDLIVDLYFGWDPLEGIIRSWFFDSRGGFGGGDWVREGNTWTADWRGVLSEGQTASSVTSIQYLDGKSFLFRSLDREIDGQPLADVEVKFSRKAVGQ
jgi:uncharacterized protein (TIGR02246 family)